MSGKHISEEKEISQARVWSDLFIEDMRIRDCCVFANWDQYNEEMVCSFKPHPQVCLLCLLGCLVGHLGGIQMELKGLKKAIEVKKLMNPIEVKKLMNPIEVGKLMKPIEEEGTNER